MLTFVTHFAQTNSSGDAAAAAAGLGIGLFFMLFWLALAGLGIASFVIWLISLIHVLQHSDVKDRTMWILILLLVGNLGGLIYFFIVKRPYDKGGMREIQP